MYLTHLVTATFGVPLEEIERGIKHGVRKVNIDTDRLAMAGIIRKVASTSPSEFDVRKFMAPATQAMEAVCLDRFERFNTAGNAHKMKPVSLSDMAARYSSGSLDPVIS